MDILVTEQKPRKKSEVLAFRIDSDIVLELTAIAKRRGIKASTAAKLIIKDFVLNHPEAKRGRKTA